MDIWEKFEVDLNQGPKASGSPTLPTLQKTGSSELPPGTPTRPKPAIIKNKIPVILSGIYGGLELPQRKIDEF